MPKRTVVAIGTAFALFVSSGLVALIVLYRSRGLQLQTAIIVLTMPAFASLVMAILGNFTEGIKPKGKGAFPFNITLPLIHCSLMLALGRLLTTAPSALEKLPPQLVVASIWQRWPILGICAIFEACVISALGMSGWLN